MQKLSERKRVVDECLYTLDSGIESGDYPAAAGALRNLSAQLGIGLKHADFDSFCEHMRSTQPLAL